jgi:hypothetical protein
MESTYRILTDAEQAEAIKKGDSYSVRVPLTRQRQEEVKKLLFSALKDPRADYRPITMDELEKSWTDPDNLKIGC